VIRRLWNTTQAELQAQQAEALNVQVALIPETEGGPPIWVGGDSDAALRRALRYGAGWHGTLDLHGVDPLTRRLQRLAEPLDRDPATLCLHAVGFLVPPGYPQSRPRPAHPVGGRTPTAQSVRDHVESLREKGVASLSLWMPTSPDSYPDALNWVANAVL
jgi:Luciferase-like monooxygenase